MNIITSEVLQIINLTILECKLMLNQDTYDENY